MNFTRVTLWRVTSASLLRWSVPLNFSNVRPAVAEASNIQPVAALTGDEPFDEMADWRKVYEEFLALKQQCNEPTANLTFEKFKGTLQRNKDALVARHNCTRVKFTVYVKEGKAALKASPVK